VIKRYRGFVMADLNTYATIVRQWGNPAVVDEFMRMPELIYLSPNWRVVWPAEDYTKRKGGLAQKLAFLGTFTKAMADADVPLVVGTNAPTIPGLVPGFSLHRDLQALEQVGLTRYQVLSAATREPGEFIHKAFPDADRFGTIALRNRADLILTSGNPLDDLSTLQKPLGVMAQGHWYAAPELQSLLAGVASKYKTH